MSENTTTVTTPAVESNGTTATDRRRREKVEFFSTAEEAAKHRPATAKAEAWKVFRVTKPDGTEVYLWAFTAITAVNDVAREDGYDAGSATSSRRKPADPAKAIEDAFANWTDDMVRERLSTPIAEAILRVREEAREKVKEKLSTPEGREAASQETNNSTKPTKPTKGKK